jgi:two-component system NarL family response regulator
MKILLVDDHPIFLEGMKNLLISTGKYTVETARDGREALQKTAELRPDVILMDIIMKPFNGLETTRMIRKRFPDMKIIMLTASESEENLFESIKCGASGYLLKSLSGSELTELLTRFEMGEIPCSQDLAAHILDEFKQNSTSGSETNKKHNPSENENNGSLSKRQSDILLLVASGMKYKEIAASLGITERTVKYNMEQILDALHMGSRHEAVKFAIQSGMIE